MAEGGAIEEWTNNLSSESEFLFDFYCEFCKDDDKNVEAEGFCVNCGEYLCGMCFTSHKRTRQTRHHELLNKDEMPKDTPFSDKINKSISSTCKLHTGKPVEFYCKSHRFLGCSACFVTGHRSCFNSIPILEKSETIFDKQQDKKFIKTLKDLDIRSLKTIAKARANITKTKNCYSEVIKSIKRLKEEVINALNELEQDIVAEADALVSEKEEISNNCCKVTETIETLLAELQSLQSSRRVCQLYISMKEHREQIKTLKDEIRKAEKALVITTFKFEPNRKFQAFIENPHTLGNISFEGQMITEGQRAKANRPTQIKTAHLTDNVASRAYDFYACITGSAVVSDKRLITVDCNNLKVELSDPQTNDQISELFVSRIPWDVTVISRNEAAVTLWESEKILILELSGEIELNREISVEGKCCGVAYSKDRLVVSYTNPSKLEIMDLSGRVIKRIETNGNGSELFECPQYVCVSNEGDTIYVSDQDKNTVTSLTFDGVVKSVYADDSLYGAQKVCVDHHGNVYVCGFDSTNVHIA